MAKKPKLSPGTIAQNKRARFEYQLHDKFEAGLVLTGWEVKALREGKCQIGRLEGTGVSFETTPCDLYRPSIGALS